MADVMRFWSLLGMALGMCDCARPAPAPPVPADTIFVELVEGGCVDPKDDGGLAAVQLAVFSDGSPSWFTCLREGGTVSGCKVPCP